MKKKDRIIQALKLTLQNIADWKADALGHDDDMGYEPREFCEDVDLIEGYAKSQLEVIFDSE